MRSVEDEADNEVDDEVDHLRGCVMRTAPLILIVYAAAPFGQPLQRYDRDEAAPCGQPLGLALLSRLHPSGSPS